MRARRVDKEGWRRAESGLGREGPTRPRSRRGKYERNRLGERLAAPVKCNIIVGQAKT